ncbi:MAG TPA: hypothetical protein VGQ18_11970 [Gemmatimonadales bacterium]|jgi:hypothetical protein|nr:hypothetical protein [Gemmatimonadales bacterium]
MPRNMHILLVVLGASAIAACRDPSFSDDVSAANSAVVPTQVTRSFEMPVRAAVTTAVTGCDNSPGPYITVEGGLSLGGLGTRIMFTNNSKGTHNYTDEAHVDLTVVPAGETIAIPKQPVLGGVGGNPFIWVQLEDGNGRALTGEIYLGRCVQGLTKNTGVDYAAAARALATIAVQDCENSPGPYITMDGDLYVNAGLDAVLIFQNNDNPVDGPHRATADNVVKVELIPPGHDVRFAKQPSQGGVGGNPWIWFNFLDGTGVALEQPSLLGRCEQLSKA